MWMVFLVLLLVGYFYCKWLRNTRSIYQQISLISKSSVAASQSAWPTCSKLCLIFCYRILCTARAPHWQEMLGALWYSSKRIFVRSPFLFMRLLQRDYRATNPPTSAKISHSSQLQIIAWLQKSYNRSFPRLWDWLLLLQACYRPMRF